MLTLKFEQSRWTVAAPAVAIQAGGKGSESAGERRKGAPLIAGQRVEAQEDVRFRVLRLLQENSEMSQRDLAAAVGLSVGGIHYCINAMIDKGLVKLGNFTAAQDKRRYAYILTPKGLSEKAALTSRFLERKMREYDVLKAEIDALKSEIRPSPTRRDSRKLGQK